mmetsp:Transcript_16769/g.45673  ORF Transcript_16769/g.45673 Transcript_16769/m.45673 type:complete len:162 (-) Transcript_16769:1639-2124(-)
MSPRRSPLHVWKRFGPHPPRPCFTRATHLGPPSQSPGVVCISEMESTLGFSGLFFFVDSMRRFQQGGDDHGTPLWFDLVDISRLRQSLARELLGSSSSDDAGRLCDDFVLLCHLAGNDFLPPLPGYSVVDGMGTLLREYKALVGRWRGFITSDEGAQVRSI